MTIEKVELTLSNNRCEDYIRPFVLGRKNWLFADSETCAQVSASIYSIVVSAKANNIDVFEYLKDLFNASFQKVEVDYFNHRNYGE